MDELLKIRMENNIIYTPNLNFDYSEGVGTILYQKLKEGKGRAFQIDAKTKEIDTYDHFLQRCIRTAITMRNRGVKPNDVITVCSSAHFNTNVPFLATFFVGARCANIDPKLPFSDIVHLIKLVRPKIIFASTNVVHLIDKVTKDTDIHTEIVVFGNTTVHTPFSNFLVKTVKEMEFEPYKVCDLKEVAAIVFTSGTSGLSKGICLNHYALLRESLSIKALGDQFSGCVVLASSLIYWITYILVLFDVIIGKMTRLIITDFDPYSVWNLVKEFQVSMLILSTTQIALLLELPPPLVIEVPSLYLIRFGGSFFSEEQMLKLRSYVPNSKIIYRYGLTELCSKVLGFSMTKHDFELFKNNPLSCGRPIPGFTYKIVDPDSGDIIGPNQEGELFVKTEYQMSGYYNTDASDQWDSDGFLKTGDLAYYDENYCFFIVGRLREMFRYRGFQILPTKLEIILKSHPAVNDVCIVPIRHPIDIERPAALIVLNPQFKGKILEGEIREEFDQMVDDIYKLRGGVKFIKEVVRNSAGKILRRVMINLLRENKI